jgi:hypothetical protein
MKKLLNARREKSLVYLQIDNLSRKKKPCSTFTILKDRKEILQQVQRQMLTFGMIDLQLVVWKAKNFWIS